MHINLSYLDWGQWKQRGKVSEAQCAFVCWLDQLYGGSSSRANLSPRSIAAASNDQEHRKRASETMKSTITRDKLMQSTHFSVDFGMVVIVVSEMPDW